MKHFNLYISLTMSEIVLALIPSCVSIPKGAKAVKPFDEERYLGKWFEIARLDMRLSEI